MQDSIYFIALLPSTQILAEVRTFKLYAKEHFASGRALRSPAHITLEPPFKWADSQINIVEDFLESFAKVRTSFPIDLENFSAFPPRVIFVDIKDNKQLNALQIDLKNALRQKLNLVSDRPERPFHPHMTVAFKDLRKSIFPKAWEYYSKQGYLRSFTAETLTLLRHNGKVWEIRKEFPFNQFTL